MMIKLFFSCRGVLVYTCSGDFKNFCLSFPVTKWKSLFVESNCTLSGSQVLAQNSGYDPQETLVKLQTEHKESGAIVGVNLNTGMTMLL